MLIHIALFKWKPSAKPQDVQNALADISSLAEEIPGIEEIICAENISKYSEGYTHVVLVKAESPAALDAYRNNSTHKRIAQVIEKMEDNGIGVDFSTANAIRSSARQQG